MPIDRRTLRCRMRLAFTTIVFGLLAAAPPQLGAFEPRPVPGRILLQLHEHVDPAAFTAASDAAIAASELRAHVPGLAALAERFQVTSFRAHFPGAVAGKAGAAPDLSRFFIVDFPPQLDLEDVRRAYAADPAVRIAEYDWMQPLHYEPNDLGNTWHIESSTGNDAHVTGGWNHSRGDPSVVIGILDSGVDWQHPDLGGSGPDYTDGNLWTNATELAGTAGVDDDANGYVDDIRGWDFVFDLGTPWPGEDGTTPDNDPRDFNGHGTHVAGIAGAITDNGIGVAGVGFNSRVMALRIGGSIREADGREVGVVFMSAAAAGIEYARQQGVAVLNCSWGSNAVAALVAAVNRAVAANMVFCVSAGNDNADAPSYLAQRGDCIDVAATTSTDHRAAFSNFGGWVDVTAPGADIYSTLFDHTVSGAAAHKYGTKSGTSMAAPLVAGLAALVKAREPWLTAPQVRARIQTGADPIDALNPGDAGKLGTGRVNALRTFGDRFLTVPDDYPSVAKALIASGTNDTLAVRGGPSALPPLFLNRNRRWILGGWNADYSRRDPAVPTSIDAGGNGPALEIVTGTDRTLVIDGFAFRGGSGRAVAGGTGMFGGGILCVGASPTLRNCTFAGNVVGGNGEPGSGGGGYFETSTARLESCRFDANAAREGCGAYVLSSDLELIDCSFVTNTAFANASGRGAGLLAESSRVTITRGRFEGNAGAQEGGGIYVRGADVVLEDTRFACNTAAFQGGGMLVGAGGSAEIRNSSFHNCNAVIGAGVALEPGSTLHAVGVRWSSNRVTALGGGIFAQGARATLVNCTWDSNFGGIGGSAAVHSTQASATWVIRNSIVTNHVQVAMRFVSTPVDLAHNVYWNNDVDVEGGELGPEALRTDPLYVGPGDYELGVHSPAIDSGDPDSLFVDADASRNNRGAHGGPAARSRAPRRPETLTVSRKNDHNEIAWAAAAEDVANYVVYRGDTANFSPSAATAIATVPAGATAFVDAGGAPAHWYTLAAIDATGASSGFSDFVPTPGDPTSGGLTLPARFVLRENEPNPFNPRTRIRFDLPRNDRVRLEIYDVRGRLVRRLVDAHVQAGCRDFVWDGRDDAGRALGSGTYVVRLRTPSDDATRKMTLLR